MVTALKRSTHATGGTIVRDNRLVALFRLCSTSSRRPATALFLAGLLLLVSAVRSFAGGGDILWQSADTRAGKQQALASTADAAGNVIIAGYQNLTGNTNNDYFTVKFKADGSGLLWSAVYDKSGGADQINDVTVDANNDVIVTGTVWNGINLDIHTVKYCGATGSSSCGGKSGGEVIWEQTFNGTANGNDAGSVVSVDQNNDVYVGGYSQNSAGKEDYLLLKYPATGGLPSWQARYSGPAGYPGTNKIAAVAAGASGVAVTGQSWNGTVFECATIKYDLQGNQLWPQVKRYTDGSYPCFGKVVKMDAAGNVVVAASASNGIDLDIYTAKYAAADGSQVWSDTFDGRESDEPKGMAIDAAGNVFLTGYSSTPTGHYDFYTAKLDSANGNTLWSNIYDSGNGNTDITAESDAIALDAAGDAVFVTGYKITDGITSFETLKYKIDNGEVIWQRLFNGTAGKSSRPVGLGLAPSGDLLIAGWADTAATDLDYIVVKYDRGILNPPTGLTAQPLSDTSIRLTWRDNSANEDGFKIERCKLFNCADFTALTEFGPGVTTYTDTGLDKDSYYSYRVKAYIGENGSQYTTIAQTLTTGVTAVPPAATYTYNGSADSNDYAAAIAFGPDNNPVVAGASHDYFPGYSSGNLTWDYLTVKLDRSSSLPIWSERYDDPTSASDIATCVAVDSSNIATVSGYATLNINTADVNSLFTLRYKAAASSPQALTADQYNGPGATDDRAVAIATAVDASDNVAVVGYGKNTSGNDDIYLLKYSATGTRLWDTTPFDGGGDDMPAAVAFASDGSIYVTGYSEKSPVTNPKTYNFYTARHNGTNGDLIWRDVYSAAPASGDNKAAGLAFDSNGDLYVTGYATTAAGNAVFHTIKYQGGNAAPHKLWERTTEGSSNGNDRAIGVKTDPIDGTIVVAGTSRSQAGDLDYRAIRYTRSGDTVWDKSYQKPDSAEEAHAVAIDSNGTTYVTGDTYNGSTRDSLTIAFSYLQGNIVGATRYNGAADNNDNTDAIAINAYDEAFAAGYTTRTDASTDLLVYKIVPPQPSAPVPLSGATPTISTATLTWPARAADKDGYKLQRKAGDCSAANTNIWDTARILAATATTYTDTNLIPGTTYCYQIQSFRNSDGAASRWNQVSVTLTPASAPAGLTATAAATTQVNLNWSDTSSGETGFRVERCSLATCTDSDFVQTGAIRPANATSYSDIDACSATAYQYRIIAVGTGWESAPSNIFTAAATATPTTPLLTVTRASETQVNLSWTDGNTDQSGYNVEHSLDGTLYTTVATALSGSARAYNDATAAPGVTNYYRVIAYKTATCGWSSPSLPQNAITSVLEPNAITATANSTTQITLGWADRTASETGFRILRCQGSGCTPDPTPIFTAAANATAYIDTAVTENTVYNYQVVATNSTLPWESVASARVELATRTAAPPSDLSATRTSEAQINLTWSDTANNDETGYKVYRCEGSGCTPTVQLGSALAANTFSYSDTAVSPGATYVYRVAAFKTATNGWEKVSASSAPVTAAIQEPNAITATANSTTQITLGWADRTASETGFKILRCQGSGCTPDPTPIFTAAANATSYIDTTVSENTVYNYQVVAINSTLPWESVTSAKVERATPAATAPQLTTVTRASEAQITIAWTDSNSDRTGFRLWRCAGQGCANFTQIGGVITAPLSYDDSGLSPNTSYSYYVETFKTVSSERWAKQSGQLAATTTLLEPNNVTAATNSTTQVTLNWADRTASETGFEVWRCANPPCTATYLATAGSNATSYPDSSVCQGTSYMYQVMATNSAVPWYSTAVPLAAAVTTPAPVAPTAFTATQLNESSVKLDWDDPNSDETGYKVERCSGDSTWCGSDDARFTVSYSLAANTITYTNSGLAPNSTYTYRVRAFKTADCSWSLASTAQTVTTTVPAPAELTLQTLSSTDIKLTWTNTTSTETGFVVERCTGAGCSDFYPLAAASSIAAHATTFTDSSACGNSTYSYRIKAKNAGLGWESGYSTPATIATPHPSPAYPNLLLDPNFEDTASGWPDAPANGAVTGTSIDTAVFSNGARSLKIVGAAETINGRAQTVAVDAGQQYVLSGYINSTLTAGGVTCNLYGTGMTADPGFGLAANDPRNDSWVYLSEVVTIPAGTTAVAIQCFTTAGAVGAVNVDAMNFSKAFTVTTTAINEAGIRLSWADVSSDETGYRILKCSGPTCTPAAQVNANVLTYSDGGLTPPGTVGNYQVLAYKTATCGWSSPASSITAATTMATPPAPSGLTATAISTTQINLAWSNNTAAETGIVVERCQGEACSFDGSVLTTTGAGITSYIDTAVINGTAYSYRVKALNSTLLWSSAYSPTVSLATPAAAAPILAEPIAVSDTRINLSWSDPNTDETHYLVLRDNVVIATLAANSTSYGDTGVTAGTSYTYLIRATKDATTPWAVDSNSKTISPATPPPTSLGVAVASSTQLNLTWINGTTTETEVRVERCQDAGCSNFAEIAVIPKAQPDTGYQDTAVVPGTTYRYQVRAANTTLGWTSAYSSAATATTPALVVPGTTTATRSSEVQINLSWSASSGVSGYNVYYCTGSGCTPSILAGSVAGATTTTFQHTGLAVNTSYRYLRKAYKTGTTGCPDSTTCESGAGTTTANILTTLTGPSTLTAQAVNSTSVRLQWTNNTVSETGFVVERCTPAGGCSFAEIVNTAAPHDTSWVDDSVAKLTSYQYRIRAANAAWTTSATPGFTAFSNTATATTPDAGPPYPVSAITGTNKVTLTWGDNCSAGTQEEGFTLLRCTGSGCDPATDPSQVIMAYPGANATSSVTKADSTVCSNQAYVYKVQAYNNTTHLCDFASTPLELTTALPAAPVLTTVSRVSEVKLTLAWNDATPDTASYDIYRCSGSSCADFSKIGSKSGTPLTYDDTSVLPGTAYSYQVRGNGGSVSGCGQPWQTVSNTVSQVANINVPASLTATPLNLNRIDLAWSDTDTTTTGWQIERCTGSGCTDFTELATLATRTPLSYSDSAVTANTTYQYRLRASGSTTVSGNTYYWLSDYSAVATAATAVPIAPSALTATMVSATQINLTWTASTTADLTGYAIERCTGAGCLDFTQITTVTPATATFYANTAIAPSTTFRYRLRGYKSSGGVATGYSNIAEATTLMAAPGSLTAQAIGSHAVKLAWNEVFPGQDSVAVLVQIWNGEWVQLANVDGATSEYTDMSGVSPLATYTYQVRAFRGNAFADSNLATVTMPGYVPADASLCVAGPLPNQPQITSTPLTTASEGVVYSYTVTATAMGSGNSIAAYALAVKPNGMSINPATGTITWTPDYTQAGSMNVTVRVTDALGVTAIQSFVIAVANDSQLPRITSTAVTTCYGVTCTVGQTYQYQVSAYDPEGNSLSYALTNAPAGMAISAAGLISWTADTGTNSVTVSVGNGSKSQTQSFTIPVTAYHPLAITSTPNTSAVNGAPYSYQLTVTNSDNYPLSYTLTTAPAGMTISPSGTIAWVPSSAQSGDHQVTVQVSDGSSIAPVSQSYTLTVSQYNVPAVTAIPSQTASEGVLFSYQVVATAPLGGPLTYSLSGAPNGMSISAVGLISWTPAAGQGVSGVTVTVRVQAGSVSANSATRSFTLNAPYISSTPGTTPRASVGVLYSYTVTANSAGCSGSCTPLGYALINSGATPPPTGMTINASTGLVSWTPVAGQTGYIPVTVKATFGTSGTIATQTFNISVPAIVSTPLVSAAVGSDYSTTATASDPAGGSFTWSLTTAPTGMTIDASGKISWTPSSGSSSVPVTVRATVNGTSPAIYATQSFTLSVVSVTSTPPTTALAGYPYSYQLSTTGTTLTYSLDTAPAGMTVSAAGLISWPSPTTGSIPVTVRVTTGGISYVTQAYTLVVAEPPPPPPAPLLDPQAGGVSGTCAAAHTFSWSAVTPQDADPVWYNVQVDTVNSFDSSNRQQSGWLAATSTPLNLAVYGGSTAQLWYWRVLARDNGHEQVITPSATAFFTDGAVFWDCNCDNSCQSTSCPLVYSFDGTRFSYESDIAGPMISQYPKGPRSVSIYQPVYMALDKLVPDANQQYRVKIWESLNEGTMLDEAKLLAVDYPAGYEIASSSAENTYYNGYANPFSVYTLKNPVLPVSALDKTGADVRSTVLAMDDIPAPITPNAADNTLTLDFGTIQHPEYAKLVIDGWMIINSKLYTSPTTISPFIEVVDGNGAWVKVKTIGMPAGDLKRMVVDLGGLFLSADHRIRVNFGVRKTTLWVIDRVRLDDSAPVAVTIQELSASAADLQSGGQAITEMSTPQHRIHVGDNLPLKANFYGYGNFTRYGAVTELLTQRDDKFVLMNYADKLELTFPALSAPAAGITRAFMIKADLYYKEFKDYKYLAPLPFHGMSDYPPPAPEAYPTDADHNQYQQLYNTRVVAP
jgi:fibronectin type 3 domain-containing protein